MSILLNNYSMEIELKVMPISTEKYRSTNISGDYAAVARAFVVLGEPTTASRLRDHFQPARRHVRLKRMVKHRHKTIPSKRSPTSPITNAKRRGNGTTL